jgi:hypothetical protein
MSFADANINLCETACVIPPAVSLPSPQENKKYSK